MSREKLQKVMKIWLSLSACATEEQEHEGPRKRHECCLSLVFCCCGKDKSNLRDEGSIWLRVPGYGSSWWGIQGGRTGAAGSHSIHKVKNDDRLCSGFFAQCVQAGIPARERGHPSRKVFPSRYKQGNCIPCPTCPQAHLPGDSRFYDTGNTIITGGAGQGWDAAAGRSVGLLAGCSMCGRIVPLQTLETTSPDGRICGGAG